MQRQPVPARRSTKCNPDAPGILFPLMKNSAGRRFFPAENLANNNDSLPEPDYALRRLPAAPIGPRIISRRTTDGRRARKNLIKPRSRGARRDALTRRRHKEKRRIIQGELEIGLL